MRRTFFDQAPTLNPAQTTGQVSGPITGTLGAVDPESDPMTYSVVQAPQDGAVTLNPDGTFDYAPDRASPVVMCSSLQPATNPGHRLTCSPLSGPLAPTPW